MLRLSTILLSGALIASASLIGATGGQADPIQQFYQGKTIAIIASTGAGGPYDITARALARHMPRYIPGNPAMIVRNMPGGGHMLATNHMFNQAAKDGTAIATVANTIPIHQVLDGKGVRYDARQFNWIGSTGSSNLLTVAWHTSGVKSIEDAKAKEIPTGATGAGSGTALYPTVMNHLLGTKFKIVMGYKTSSDIDLAMERGEVAVRSGGSYAGLVHDHPDWLKDKKVNILTQIGAEREAELPDVPLMHELAQNGEQREILKLISSPVSLGRPFFAPPEVPAERVAALRRAFDATMKDPEFLKEAKQLNLDLSPISGAAVEKIVKETIDVPKDILTKAQAAMGPSGEAN